MDTKNDPISYARLPFWNCRPKAAVVPWSAAFKQTKKPFQRQFGITTMRENYAILDLPAIGKLCAIVYHKTMANRLISLDRKVHQV